MKRFNFGTFLTDDANRQAFQICKDVAELKPVPKRPVLLLGDEGCGKTHLLCAIVNRIRAGSARTGLAYVTAHDFPDQVRALIDDPSPVTRAPSAILLVDQLERFRDLVEELEGVVRIFLDNNHAVVLASSVHPSRLQHLTSEFRALLESGLIVSIAPKGPEVQIELIRRQARQEAEDRIRNQAEEIQRLRDLVRQAGEAEGAGESSAGLAASLASERAEKEELLRKLSVAKAFSDSVQQELTSLQAELKRTREFAQRVTEDQGASATGQADRAALEAEVAGLREELKAAQEEGEQARNEADQLLKRAEGLLGQIESNRVTFTQREQEQQRRIAELEAALTQGAAQSDPAELAKARARVDELEARLESVRAESEERRTALEQQLAESMQRLETQLAEVQAERDETRTTLGRIEVERDSFHQALTAAQGARDELEAQLEEQGRVAAAQEQDLGAAQRQVADREQELEMLRREAAAQVAQAHAQAGELEGRLARIETAAEQVRDVGGATAARLASICQELSTLSSSLSDLAAGLADECVRRHPVGQFDPGGPDLFEVDLDDSSVVEDSETAAPAPLTDDALPEEPAVPEDRSSNVSDEDLGEEDPSAQQYPSHGEDRDPSI